MPPDFFRAAQSIDRYDDSGPIPPPAFVLVTTDNRSSLDGRKSQLLQKAIDLGFADILLKPVSRRSLELTLAAVAASRTRGAAPTGAPATAATSPAKPVAGKAPAPSTASAPPAAPADVASLEQQLAELRASLQSMQRDLASSIGRVESLVEKRRD